MDKLEKDALVQKLISTEDDAILDQVKVILSDDKDFWDDLPEHVKEGINKAKEDIKQGKGIPHEQVMAEIKARYLNK